MKMKKIVFGLLFLCLFLVSIDFSHEGQYKLSVAVENIEALASEESPDPNKWTAFDFPCYDSYGESKKSRRNCMLGGFLNTCVPHDCQ